MSIYDHFRKEEHPFIDQVLSWRDFVENQYTEKLTDFLDPREQQIVQQVIGTASDVKLAFFGGSSSAERKRALLYPEYLEPETADFQCRLYEIDYPHKFVSITHRDVLGALMGLGIKREKFGDIFLDEERIQMMIATEIASFVEMNLTSIGKANVTLSLLPFSEVLQNEEEWLEAAGSVSSLRLDAVIAEIYRMPRQKAISLIKGGGVKVNWKTVDQPSFELQAGDILSVRGYGRSKFLELGSKTKKDKWRISYGRQK